MEGLRILGLIFTCALIAVPTTAALQTPDQLSTKFSDSSSHDKEFHYPYTLAQAEYDVSGAFKSLKQHWTMFSKAQEQLRKREMVNFESGSGKEEQLHPY